MVIRSFSMPDPTWLELSHFVAFLNTQLNACEKSIYTDPLYVDDANMNVLGFKSFVAMFMIKMSVVSTYNTKHIVGIIYQWEDEFLDIFAFIFNSRVGHTYY